MRYLVFAFDSYYPRGGMTDCIFKCNNKRELKIYFLQNNYWKQFEFVQIYDTKENAIFEETTLFDAF